MLLSGSSRISVAARMSQSAGARAVTAATTEHQPLKRRKMSAAARKAIADAQKARWVKRKAAAGGSATRIVGKKK
jgi:hypothetical protein